MTGIIAGYCRNLVQGICVPFRAVATHSSLLGVLVRRDITSRTSGTVLGSLWPLLQPALQVLGFWFLFDVIYGMRMNTGPSFLEYLLIGLLPWLCLSEVLSRAANMLMEFSPLYKRNPFPLEILPLLIMVIPCCVYTLVYFVLCFFMFGIQTALMSLLVMPLLMLWLLPFCLLFPVLGLFMKDFTQAVPFLLTILMYGTPILYFPEMLPDSVEKYLLLNPLADIMTLIHGVVQGREMAAANLFRPLLLWLLLLGPAWLIFRRSVPHIREVL